MLKILLVFLIMCSVNLEYALGNVISKIYIKGNQRIESSTILSYLNIKKNDSINEQDLNIVFKDLFATELFSNISFELKDNTLYINVTENL